MIESGVLIGMTVAGATCELIGIGLVVREIAADRKLAQDALEQRAPLSEPPPDDPPITYWGPISRFLRMDWDAVTQVNKKEFQQAMDDAVYRLIEADRNRDHAIRELVNRQLAGNISGRLMGVIFFAVGIVLAMASQVLQFIER